MSTVPIKRRRWRSLQFIWLGVRTSPADGEAARLSSSAGRDRRRPRRAAATRDNGNRDGPTDRERQPRGASRACHLSSQPPHTHASVPDAPFKIKLLNVKFTPLRLSCLFYVNIFFLIIIISIYLYFLTHSCIWKHEIIFEMISLLK